MTWILWITVTTVFVSLISLGLAIQFHRETARLEERASRLADRLSNLADKLSGHGELNENNCRKTYRQNG